MVPLQQHLRQTTPVQPSICGILLVDDRQGALRFHGVAKLGRLTALRSRCAVYVDAGYLLAASATRIAGTSLRGSIEADHEKLIGALIAHAENTSGLPLLRVHWYDAAQDAVPDQTQQSIGLLPHVKLRLGRIGFDGEQKGVDLRIGLDLVGHARNGAVDMVFLVSGDDDLAEAVEEAQAHGVQVIILAVPTTQGSPHGVSRHLHAVADGLELLAADDLDNAVKPTTTAPREPTPSAPIATAPETAPTPALLAARAPTARLGSTTTPVLTPGQRPAASGLVYSSSTDAGSTLPAAYLDVDGERVAEAIDQVVHRVLRTWLDSHTAQQQAELLASRPSIPRDVDRALLRDLSDALNTSDLHDTLRYRLRAQFWVQVDEITRP